MGFWPVRELEGGHPPEAQHTTHLTNISERDLGIRDVPEHDVGDACVHRARSDGLKGASTPMQPCDVLEVEVQGPRPAEHLAGNIEGVDVLRPPCQRPGEPPQAAADVDHHRGGLDRGSDGLQQPVQRLLTPHPERLLIRRSVLEPAVHEPEGVLARPGIPEALHVGAGHSANCTLDAQMRILHVGEDWAALRPCGLTFYSEALMRAQAAAGHDVSYVFAGRHYPRLERPRLKRWSSGSVRMFELVGSPIHSHWEHGTREPALDLEEPAGEGVFATALEEARPDLVHIHELSRLPSSVIEIARDCDVPVVATLHDYKMVCASVRLLDADQQRCTRLEVGVDCARNCAGAPTGRAHLVDWTLRYHRRQVKRAVPLVDRVDFTAAGPLVGAVNHRLARAAPNIDQEHPPSPSTAQKPAPTAPPEDYQRRRKVNLQRLSLCDRLIAPSPRVARIHEDLGVPPSRLVLQTLTLPHLERLRPGRGSEPGTPLTFITLGGCASPAKGSRVVAEAVSALERRSPSLDYRLVVMGHVEPEIRDGLAGAGAVLQGLYTPADLDEHLDAADVGLLPSIWEETHGFVGIEMLAKGLPVIGSEVGGIPEYVRKGETGWLNRSATGTELAELMARAVESRDEVKRLRASVRALRSELVVPMDRHVAEVESLYDDVLSEAGPGQAAANRSPASRRWAS